MPVSNCVIGLLVDYAAWLPAAVGSPAEVAAADSRRHGWACKLQDNFGDFGDEIFILFFILCSYVSSSASSDIWVKILSGTRISRPWARKLPPPA